MVPSLATLRERPWRGVLLALVGLAIAGLALRLYALGYRVMYYDEAWFSYWALQYVETGVWEYRPILHGPFFTRVNAVVFPTLGASDVTARLVVATIGGLLPLSAWLFRERLRDVEVLALGAVLALNPILLYYGRMMRKDLPLAAFMLVALGLFVRARDTGRPWYAYAAAVALGLAASTKESVLLWGVAWLGAAVLLLDRRLLLASHQDTDAVGALRSVADRLLAGLRSWAPHLFGATLLFLAVIVFFYAPRSPGLERPGLWKALGGEYGTLPQVVEMATVDSIEKAIGHWVGGSKQEHPYLPYLTDTLRTMGEGALAVSLLAVVGFLHDRYTGASPRDLVAFNFYVGVAAIVGYPLANNFPVPWSTIHAVVPLAIPAAVGVGVLIAWGRGRLAGPLADRAGPVGRRLPQSVSPGTLRGVIAVGLLVLLALNSAAVGVQTSYVAPHESPRADPGSEVIYYAQPPGSLRIGIDAIDEAAATGGDDVDVLYVGRGLAADPGEDEHPTQLETSAWFARMPLPWYTLALDADVESALSAADIEDPPPVVITSPDHREAVAERLGDEYTAREQPLDDVGDRTVVFFVREE